MWYFYFGRNDKNDENYLSKSKLKNQRGCALFLKKNYAKELIEKHFKVVEIGEVTKKPWDDENLDNFLLNLLITKKLFIKNYNIIIYKTNLIIIN